MKKVRELSDSADEEMEMKEKLDSDEEEDMQVEVKEEKESDSDSDKDDDKAKVEGVKKEEEKKVTKPGIIYLSRIPPKMNVKQIREYFGQFGDINRSFLQPESKLG